MERTQIYLTAKEKKALKAVAERMGTTQSGVIRAAVDRFLAPENRAARMEFLRSARGIWKQRKDLPDFGSIRRELDRRADSAE